MTMVDLDAVIAAIEGCGLDAAEHSVLYVADAIAAIRALPTSNARIEAGDALVVAAKAIQQDLIDRAEWSPSAGKVVCAGNSAWFNFCNAIEALDTEAIVGDGA